MPQGHKHLVNPPFAHLYKCISHIYDQSGTVLGVIHTEVLLPSSDWHIVGAQLWINEYILCCSSLRIHCHIQWQWQLISIKWLLWASHPAQSANSFHPRDSLCKVDAVLALLHRWGTCGLEQVSNLCGVTQEVAELGWKHGHYGPQSFKLFNCDVPFLSINRHLMNKEFFSNKT